MIRLVTNLSGEYPLILAVKSKDNNIRSRCTSGGIFLELAKATLAAGGIVYGCAFNDNLVAVHIRCETSKDIERCVGSKYSQSDLGTSFADVLDDLRLGRKVLFTGTPCQVAGLRNVVPVKLQDDLLAVDLVCHGAPSPVLFQQNLGNIERARGKEIVGYVHRPKNKGWGEHLETIEYSDGSSEQGTRLSGVWKEIFYSNEALRPSCYSCPWSLDRRPGDITIGDYWGIERECPEYKDPLGVSLVVANNEKGKKFIERLDLELIKTKLETATNGNPNLVKPTALPAHRQEVWDDFTLRGFVATTQSKKFYVSTLKHACRKAKLLLKPIYRKVKSLL